MAHRSRTRHLIGGEYYVFRDAVHNLIAIEDEQEGQDLRRLLRTRELQRLRRIRQNGLGSLVYPSLENSRFAHALGTFAVGRRVAAALQDRVLPAMKLGMPTSLSISRATARAFCLTALMHDVGHGPLSHVWEDVVADRGGRSTGGDAKRSYHEVMTEKIVSSDATELGRLLLGGDEDPRPSLQELRADIVGFLQRAHPLRYLIQLLSGPLDVDRLDFMGRDTRSAGVTYGFHELDWIVRSLRFAHRPARDANDEPGWVVALDGRKGLTTISQFLEARANMYRLVYHHKTIRAATCMLLSTLRRYVDLSKIGDTPCPSPALKACLQDPSGDSLQSFLELDDGDVWQALKVWSHSGDQILSQLAGGFLSRELFKVVELDSEYTFRTLQGLCTPGAGAHLQRIVARRLEVSESDAEYFFKVESVSFDVVGAKQDGLADEMWILEAGRLGPRFKTMREFWQERTRTTSTAEVKYLLIAHQKVIDDLVFLAESVRIANSPQAASVESVGPSTELDAPKPVDDEPIGYRVLAALGAKGASKEAYLGATRDPGAEPESLVALKRYQGEADVLQVAIEHDAFAPNLLIPDDANVTRARVVKSPKGVPWLAEPLWSASLNDLVLQEGRLRDLEQLFDIAVQLFKGLKAIHGRGLRHTDIKPENCGIKLVGRDFPVYVIGDFGCVSAQPDVVPTKRESIGTLKTRPPEMFMMPPSIGLGSDVWSLGATIYAACARRYPFMEYDVKLGPLDNPVRRARENEISQNIKERHETFLKAYARELPPCLARPLGACFLPLNKRRKAADVLRDLEKEQAKFRNLVDEKQLKARWAWQRAEDLLVTRKRSGDVRLRSKEIANEASEIAGDLKDYVPPDVRKALLKVR
jgi:hypothetical protein